MEKPLEDQIQDLYLHRNFLFISLMASHPEFSWWSLTHSDGSPCEEGWFIAGMNITIKKGGQRYNKQVSYHLPIELQPLCKRFCLGVQPKWDGHTSIDVANTFIEWVKSCVE